jgi:hypothetical protein
MGLRIVWACLANFYTANHEEDTLLDLLGASVDVLQNQGMKKVFLDGVMERLDHLKRLGNFLGLSNFYKRFYSRH